MCVCDVDKSVDALVGISYDPCFAQQVGWQQ